MPFLFVYSPTLILVGDWVPITVDFVTALVGIWLVSMSFVGFALRPISFLERLAYAAAGAGLLMPLALWEYAVYCNVAGVLLGALLLGREYLEKQRERAAQVMRPKTEAGRG